MDVEVELSDANSENHIVDPIEFGKLLHAVETINGRLSHLAEFESGLQHANEDIRFLKDTQARIISQQDEMIRQMKHLNGADKKLESLGFRLEDSKEHRKDQLYLRSTRRRSESRHVTHERIKTGVLTAVAISAAIWVLSTLWQARETIGVIPGG